MKTLLIVYHSQGGSTERLARAACEGARREDAIETRLQRAFETGVDDLLNTSGLIIGTAEHLGYMSGAIKDFFDRTYYPAQGKVDQLPYAVFVKAGTDGRNTVTQIERIATGYNLRRVAEPIIVRGDVTEADVERCRELGHSLAAGIAFGIY